MKNYILLFTITFLSSCAAVGPVEIDPDDTWFTIIAAVSIAVFIFFAKSYIEYIFQKRIERYKRSLDKNHRVKNTSEYDAEILRAVENSESNISSDILKEVKRSIKIKK